MSSTTLFQHPRHDQHPLEPRDFSKDSITLLCDLCNWKISTDGYACKECQFYSHRVCAEAPPQIDLHPLHTDHPLTLIHGQPSPYCDACGELFNFHSSSFRCKECDLHVCIRCALSTLSVQGGSPGGTTPEQINLPIHNHTLTSFSTRHDFVWVGDCMICKASIEGDGYACLNCRCGFLLHKRCVQDLFGDEYDFNRDINCASSTLLDRGGSEEKTPKWIALPLHHHLLTLFSTRYDFVKATHCMICEASVEEDGDGYTCLHWQCQFLIHKRCIPDLYYRDGTKAPQIYHGHPLETFHGEDTGSSRCAKCRSDESRELIGCAKCQVFYCRDCVQVPEFIQHPHHPDHTLVLLINTPGNYKSQCDTCSNFLEGDLCYGCPFCDFFAHAGCALQVFSYCEEGMSAEIKLSWHKHPLLLGRVNKAVSDECSYCEDISAGPMYTCKEGGCELVLHKRCTEIESTIIHPHHQDHPLTLCDKEDYQSCRACSETMYNLKFSCKLCAFYIHAKCAARFPSQKHSLHEHELLHLNKAPSWDCNRCGTSTDSPFFRCVPCNFNLHEECMELPPRVVNSEVHWHPLTLHETYIEDDSGEYYCDRCEKRRDGRLGVYVCLQCSARWAYHVECILPELLKVFEKGKTSIIRRFNERIARKDEEVHAVEVKLEEMKQELDQLIKERDELIKERDELISGEGL